MSSKIATISNLTSGGGVIYMNNLVKALGKNVEVEFSPTKYLSTKKGILGTLNYIKYIYFDLLRDYYFISKKINNDQKVEKVVVFQDAYVKAPYALLFLRKRSIYILHEPPREFYEPILLHAPKVSNIVFNYLIRYPIKYIDKFLTKRATIIVSNSKYSQAVINKIYKKKSEVIYPGINIENTNSSKLKKRKRICISVGSLLPYKGHEVAINEISKMRNKPSLTIVGDGPYKVKDKLIKLAKRLEVKISIKRLISDELLIKEYQKSKVYLNCAYREPFGLAALEAVNQGCVLVTNDSGGTQELKKFFPNKVLVSKSPTNTLSDTIETGLSKKNTLPIAQKKLSWSCISNKILEL